VACATASTVRLWNTASGESLGFWPLPHGVANVLAFEPAGSLVSFRAEVSGPAAPAASAPRSLDGPWECRLRHLAGPRPLELPRSFAEFRRRLLNAAITSDGQLVVAEGSAVGQAGPKRTLACFDAATGAQRWSIASTRTALASDLILDAANSRVAASIDNSGRMKLLDLSTGAPLGQFDKPPLALSPGAEYWLVSAANDASDSSRGFALFHHGSDVPVIVLGIDRSISTCPVFSRDGKSLAWANDDGTVSLCALEELKERLGRAHLDW
jgi:WD40 repeat protein